METESIPAAAGGSNVAQGSVLAGALMVEKTTTGVRMEMPDEFWYRIMQAFNAQMPIPVAAAAANQTVAAPSAHAVGTSAAAVVPQVQPGTTNTKQTLNLQAMRSTVHGDPRIRSHISATSTGARRMQTGIKSIKPWCETFLNGKIFIVLILPKI